MLFFRLPKTTFSYFAKPLLHHIIHFILYFGYIILIFFPVQRSLKERERVNKTMMEKFYISYNAWLYVDEHNRIMYDFMQNKRVNGASLFPHLF